MPSRGPSGTVFKSLPASCGASPQNSDSLSSSGKVKAFQSSSQFLLIPVQIHTFSLFHYYPLTVLLEIYFSIFLAMIFPYLLGADTLGDARLQIVFIKISLRYYFSLSLVLSAPHKL